MLKPKARDSTNRDLPKGRNMKSTICHAPPLEGAPLPLRYHRVPAEAAAGAARILSHRGRGFKEILKSSLRCAFVFPV